MTEIFYLDKFLLSKLDHLAEKEKMFYLQTTSVRVQLSTGEDFIQCEICGRCYKLEAWDGSKIYVNEGYRCSHSNQDTGLLE